METFGILYDRLDSVDSHDTLIKLKKFYASESLEIAEISGDIVSRR